MSKNPRGFTYLPKSTATPSKANYLKINSPLPVGFINKGNTCSILQTLSGLPLLWNRVTSEAPPLSPLLKSTILNMKIKTRPYEPVDPSNFLWVLTPKISESRHALHYLISNLSKMLLRCYSLTLMNCRVLQWKPVT